jgi:anaerobic selenocysteine-containing dehydrogenase
MKRLAKNSNDREWVHSACAMCLGAPMKVKTRNAKIVAVKGEGIPGWDGKICGKALSGMADRIYSPHRILYPLKRTGERGEGKFVRCTWEEVIDALAGKLREYINAGHPEYFEIWWGCPDQQDKVPFLYYWSTVVRSGISYLHGQVCFGDHAVEKTVTFGLNHGFNLIFGMADWPRTKYAVVAGQNYPGTATNNGAGCSVSLYPIANEARKNGCRFTVVDPKLGDSASWCDDWIPIKPGTDATFALSIANILIDENLYDMDFLLKYTNAAQLIRKDNGQALKDDAGNYLVWDEMTRSSRPLPEAGKSNGLTLGLGKAFEAKIDGETIKCQTAFQMLAEEARKYTAEIPYPSKKTTEIARELGRNKPSVVFYPGFTSGRYPNWFQTLRAYSTVNLLLGNFEQPGGFYCIKHNFDLGNGWPEPPEVPEYREGLDLVPAPWGNLTSAENIDKAPCYESPRVFHPSSTALPWLHFNAMDEGKVKAVLSSAENAPLTQPNSKWVEDCLKRMELIIVGEQLPKEFVDLADYVIPEASYLERHHLYQRNITNIDTKEHSIIFMRSAVIPPQGESKPLSWFLVEVAKKVGLGAYFEKLDLDYGWWDRMLKRGGLYPTVTAKKLIEDGPYHESYPLEYDIFFKPITTRSGRFEIYSNELAEECFYHPESRWQHNPHVYPLPRYVPIAGPKAENEFYLISGKATWHQKSATQNNPYLMEDAIEGGCPYTALYINAERARNLDIADGDSVEIECIGPTSKEDPCVYKEAALGSKERARVKVTEGLHPSAVWVYFASGHKSKLPLTKAGEGITVNWFVPTTVSPYTAGVGKNYAIVKIHKLT